MAKKLSSVLGIDIGSSTIKIAEIKNSGREPMVTTLGIIGTPAGAVDHTGIFNPDAVGVALKKVIGDSGATVQDAVVSIAGQASVMVRTLEVPRMNEAELNEHMQWEVSRSTPFAESNVVNDFKPLRDDDPSTPNMDVVMAISPQSAVDMVVACMKRAGRKIAGIDVQPLGLARTLAICYDDIPATETVCLVDVGFKTTAINVYRAGKLLLPRQVPIGGEMFSQAIADSLTISFDEAEKMKLESGSIPEGTGRSATPVSPFSSGAAAPAYNPFADPASSPPPVAEPTMGTSSSFDPFSAAPPAQPADAVIPEPVEAPADAVGQVPPTPAPPMSAPPAGSMPIPQENPEAVRVYNAFSSVLSEFLEEVRRSIDFFRSRGGSIDRILISGGGAKLRGLSEYLSEALQLPCDSYDPLRRLNINVRKVAPEFIDEHRQQFAVAVGNGLYPFFD